MKKIVKSLRNPNRKPTHPGAILREDVLPALGITQAVFASHLGVGRLTFLKSFMRSGVLVLK